MDSSSSGKRLWLQTIISSWTYQPLYSMVSGLSGNILVYSKKLGVMCDIYFSFFTFAKFLNSKILDHRLATRVVLPRLVWLSQYCCKEQEAFLIQKACTLCDDRSPIDPLQCSSRIFFSFCSSTDEHVYRRPNSMPLVNHSGWPFLKAEHRWTKRDNGQRRTRDKIALGQPVCVPGYIWQFL